MTIKPHYTFIALCIAIFINGVLILSESAGEPSPIPMLMLLLLSELGFIVAMAGVYSGIKSQSNGMDIKLTVLSVACAILGIMLAYRGYLFWQSLGLS